MYSNSSPSSQGLRVLFDTIDRDRSGSITVDELKMHYRSRNPSLSEAGMNQIFQSIDRNGSGRIDFDEFCRFYSSQGTTSSHSHQTIVSPTRVVGHGNFQFGQPAQIQVTPGYHSNPITIQGHNGGGQIPLNVIPNAGVTMQGYRPTNPAPQGYTGHKTYQSPAPQGYPSAQRINPAAPAPQQHYQPANQAPQIHKITTPATHGAVKESTVIGGFKNFAGEGPTK